MTIEYFSMDNRGGVIAANIEHQDAVAAILSMDLLNRYGIFEDLSNPPKDWLISLESLDDVLVDIPTIGKYYIQVKNQQITHGLIKEICSKFEKVVEETPDDQQHMIRLIVFALAGVSNPLNAFPSKLIELSNSKQFLDSSSYQKALQELSSTYDVSQNVVGRLQFDLRRILKDDKSTFAIFAHAVRRFNPIDDIGDFAIELLFNEFINNLISPRRRVRGSFSKKEILAIIGRLRLRRTDDLAVMYRRTENGYSRKIVNARDPEADIVNRGSRQMMSAWRKAFYKRAVWGFFWGGHGSCGDCGHPLMGGISGLNGIQCPDCGYFPFMTLVAFCACGGYIIVKKQPPTIHFDLIEFVSQYILENNRICSDCGQEIPATVFAKRCILMPIPWPINEYLKMGIEGYLNQYHEKSLRESELLTDS